MADPPFTLLPANDPRLTADEELAAAAAGALAVPAAFNPVADPEPLPFGRSWLFDFELGQFVKVGSFPIETAGFGALAQWCLMAIHSARYAHPVFSDGFGMEEPDGVIGEFATGEALSDWQRNLVDALMVHERITSVENFDMLWDPTSGVLTINSFDVITDEDQTMTVTDVTLQGDTP